jgi:6-pyruvoyl-tetrahydropterin synthase
MGHSLMLVGARANFCAGHRLPQHAETHGHSYEVWAYTDRPCDAEMFQRELAVACKTLDHRMLNDVLAEPTMENIARYLCLRVNGLVRIHVIRPVEGLACEFNSSTSAKP